MCFSTGCDILCVGECRELFRWCDEGGGLDCTWKALERSLEGKTDDLDVDVLPLCGLASVIADESDVSVGGLYARKLGEVSGFRGAREDVDEEVILAPSCRSLVLSCAVAGRDGKG